MTDDEAIVLTGDEQQDLHEPTETEIDEAEAAGGEPAPSDPGVTGPRLVLKRDGVETDDVFALNPPSIVGRFDPSVGPIDVDLGNLPEGVYISRKHARITNEDDAWRIEDLGSSNGTFILRDDFERVEEAELDDGTEIAFGNARFVFRL